MENNKYKNFNEWAISVVKLMENEGVKMSVVQITENAEWYEEFKAGVTPEDAVFNTVNMF